ncbi:hypothetical protein MICRO80W_70026 [Micrococcus luteus]|nr:hypothetical protein MICRO80W_70026 [Micrococcus luteus]
MSNSFVPSRRHTTVALMQNSHSVESDNLAKNV